MAERNYRKSMTDEEFEDWVRYNGFSNVDIDDVILLRSARHLIDAARELEPYEAEANHLITNFDYMRSMSCEEMARLQSSAGFRYGCAPHEDCIGDCNQCWLDWLKSPAEDNNG